MRTEPFNELVHHYPVCDECNHRSTTTVLVVGNSTIHLCWRCLIELARLLQAHELETHSFP